MRIEIFHDVICPWCVIGKTRLDRALANHARTEVELVWRPFQLNPWMPVEGMDRRAYLSAKFGSPARAEKVYGAIARAADQEGLGLDLTLQKRTPSTLDAHRLISTVEGAGLDAGKAVALLHNAYFRRGLDIGQPDVLRPLGLESGLEAAELDRFFQSTEHRKEISASDSRARAMGIQGVPCFLVNGKFALSGAQEPAAFEPIFALAM